MAFIIDLDDDWLNLPGYVPEDLLNAVKAHEGPKPLMPTEEMLERLVALTKAASGPYKGSGTVITRAEIPAKA